MFACSQYLTLLRRPILRIEGPLPPTIVEFGQSVGNTLVSRFIFLHGICPTNIPRGPQHT